MRKHTCGRPPQGRLHVEIMTVDRLGVMLATARCLTWFVFTEYLIYAPHIPFMVVFPESFSLHLQYGTPVNG